MLSSIYIIEFLPHRILIFDNVRIHFKRNLQFTFYITLICLHQCLFMFISIVIIKGLKHIILIFDNVPIHFKRNLTIYLLYFNDLTPLVVIHVVQHINYQIYIIQNTNIRQQNFLFQDKLTNLMLYSIEMPPLVVIYVVQHRYNQLLITQNIKNRKKNF